MVTRDVWQTALRPDVSGIAVDARLFHEAGCRLVHRYRVYKNPFPHQALRGGGSASSSTVLRGLGDGHRSTCTAQDFHSRVGGAAWPGIQVIVFRVARRLRNSRVQVEYHLSVVLRVLRDAPPPVHSLDSSAQELIRSAVTEVDEMDTVEETTDTTDTPPAIIPPPPGFSQFAWPYEYWSVGDGQSQFTFTKDLPGWFPVTSWGLPVDMPSLPVSPIVPDSSVDSVTAIMESSREESFTPSEVVVIVPPAGDVRPVQTEAELLADSPHPTNEGLLADLLWAPVAPRPLGISERGDPCSSATDKVPWWRIAREGPFLAQRSTATLRSIGAECAFRCTSYRASDYASPTGEFGIPLNHPRFLEWIGVPELANLLEIGPGRWINALSRDKAMAMAVRLQRDVYLMETNLDIVDQYALSLQSTASKMIEVLEPVTFHRRRWRRVLLGLWFAALPYKWRPWGCGDPRWTLYGCNRMAGSGMFILP